jgi:hypothetical protein
MFSLAGFVNMRFLNDEGIDSPPVRKDDLIESNQPEPFQSSLPAVTEVQVHFFLENCRLAQLG